MCRKVLARREAKAHMNRRSRTRPLGIIPAILGREVGTLASDARGEWVTFEARKSGEVVIRHHGQLAGVLRGRRAVRFLADAKLATFCAPWNRHRVR